MATGSDGGGGDGGPFVMKEARDPENRNSVRPSSECQPPELDIVSVSGSTAGIPREESTDSHKTKPLDGPRSGLLPVDQELGVGVDEAPQVGTPDKSVGECERESSRLTDSPW